jgi:monoamine oxidase
MKRRTFLVGSVSGLTLLAVSACTSEPTKPEPSVPVTRTTMPQPTAFQRSAWSSDPFSLGAFSFPAVGSTIEQRAVLREPVAERVFLAGEHTDELAPGTVQGARESGQRAAFQVARIAEEGERIAVVGAGIAGATAARQLADAGYSVVVIEGRSRAGGRLLSVQSDDWPVSVELGAAWVRDASSNPLRGALDILDIEAQQFDFLAERRTLDGVTAPPSTVAQDAVAEAITWAASQPADLSVTDALVESQAGELSSSPSEAGVSDSDRLENFLVADLVVESGADADSLSSWYASDPARPSTDDLLVTGGFSRLVDDALDGLDILPSSTVSAISYGESGVSLRLARGESLSADRVIVTIPLGVLQSATVEFDPPLPFTHRGAIADLGMGQQDKIVLRFDTPFWSTDATVWSVIDGDTDFPLWYNLEPLTGEAMLVGVIGGDAATRLAEFGDRELLDAALASLEPFLDPELLPSPGNGAAD